MEPFYFKSYDRLIGIACDVPSLYYEMKCLMGYDRLAVQYHLTEGHISMWLDYIGEHDLADSLRYESDLDSAVRTLEKALHQTGPGKPKKRGRPRGSGRGKRMQKMGEAEQETHQETE
ncbi:hypothetical protein [Thermoplasma acidophilum]|uniref:Uncharacterized protein n=1 Tax=Thermoplasma acidophilum (strain ATCC 25905 / DSM 1728 / JCM 9062 / NBRC 15155 / AMRC-C165) TaxID=273075 RepID=Q9HK47_THEAC|nr:hypothetical protein [Thermoplasma acidophilum]CAC11892.1 hypothetical protein [Thermoplasma acidophilum]